MTYLQKYVISKTKDINVKAFNIITRINEPKTLIKHISCDANIIVQCVIGIKNWIIKHVSVNVKIIVRAKKIFGILAHALVRIIGI